MIEPTPPRPGEPLRASWAQRLVAYVRSLRVIAGPGLVGRRTGAGTVLSLSSFAGGRPAKGSAAATCELFVARITGGPNEDGSLPCLVSRATGGPGDVSTEAILLRPDVKRMGTVMQGTAVLAHRVSVRYSEGTEADHPEPVAGEEV